MYRGALHAPLAKPEAPHALVRCRQGRLLISTTQCKATDGPNQQRLHPKPASVLHSRQSAKDASNSGNSVASTAFVADVVAPIDTIVGRVRDAAVLGMAPRAVPLVEVQEDMVVVTAGDERIEVRANGALKLWRNKCPLVGDDGGDGEARYAAGRVDVWLLSTVHFLLMLSHYTLSLYSLIILSHYTLSLYALIIRSHHTIITGWLQVAMFHSQIAPRASLIASQ